MWYLLELELIKNKSTSSVFILLIIASTSISAFFSSFFFTVAYRITGDTGFLWFPDDVLVRGYIHDFNSLSTFLGVYLSWRREETAAEAAACDRFFTTLI